MKYITAEEFLGHINKQALAQLTDSKTGEPDMELLERVNKDAVSEVDHHLCGVYALPLLEPVPHEIKVITADIMKFRLYERRDARNLSEMTLKLYQMALNKLNSIRNRNPPLDALGVEGIGSGGSRVIKQWSPPALFRPHFTRMLGDEFTPSDYGIDSKKKI